jgi:hypothetical protein
VKIGTVYARRIDSSEILRSAQDDEAIRMTEVQNDTFQNDESIDVEIDLANS